LIINENKPKVFDIGIIEEIEKISFENKEYLADFSPYPIKYTVRLATRPELVSNVYVLGFGSGGDNYQVYKKGTYVLIGYLNIETCEEAFIFGSISQEEEISHAFIQEEKEYLEENEKIIGLSGSNIKFSETGKMGLKGKIVDKFTGEEYPAEIILGGLQPISSDTFEAKAIVIRADKGELGFDVKGNFFTKFFDWLGMGRMFKIFAKKLIRLITYDEDGRIEMQTNLINLDSRFFRLVIGETDNVEEEEFQDNILVVFGDPDADDPKGTATIRGGNRLTVKVNKTEITINKDEEGKLYIDVGSGNDIVIKGNNIKIETTDKLQIGEGTNSIVSAELLKSVFDSHTHIEHDGSSTGGAVPPLQPSQIAVNKTKSD